MRTFFFYILFCSIVPFVASVVVAHAATDMSRQDSVMGTGSAAGGYMGTYIDPQTGDKVTSVIAPPPQNQQNRENTPIIIYPQVMPPGMSSSGMPSSGTPSYNIPSSDVPSYGVMPIPSTGTIP